ncbi:MAG: pyridine nucleotide-disulfide oxidoreductase, partial [Deltaproteobacteria bacterium]
ATELQAYYVVQVEKTLERYERLVERIGKEAIWERFDPEEQETLRTWLRHGLAVRAERAAAKAAGREPNFARLVASWGGVTIVYRKRLRDSPAYRLNHEEVVKCLEEGIRFMECMNPVECITDEHNHLVAATFERMRPNEAGKLERTGEIVKLPARALMVAAGTRPNITYEREYPGTFELDEDRYFFQAHKAVKGEGGTIELVRAEQGDPEAFFTSYVKDGRFITFFGDNHPAYAGNVVKAMASAKRGAKKITEIFEDAVESEKHRNQPELEKDWVRFTNRLQHELNAVVVDALRLTDSIVEVIVQAPMAARHFRPGQFFRLQNYSVYAEEVEGFKLCMEGIALTG